MSVYYFDANVQVKYYLPEPGSVWVRQIMDEVDAEGKIVNALFTVEISMVEVAAAIAIIHRIGRIRRKLRDATFNKYMKGATSRYHLLPACHVKFASSGCSPDPEAPAQRLRRNTVGGWPGIERFFGQTRDGDGLCQR